MTTTTPTPKSPNPIRAPLSLPPTGPSVTTGGPVTGPPLVGNEPAVVLDVGLALTVVLVGGPVVVVLVGGPVVVVLVGGPVVVVLVGGPVVVVLVGGPVAQEGRVMVLVSRVTAPLRASNRP